MAPGAKKTLWAVGALVVLGLALPVSNLLVGPPKGTLLTKAQPKDAQTAKVAHVLEENCGSNKGMAAIMKAYFEANHVLDGQARRYKIIMTDVDIYHRQLKVSALWVWTTDKKKTPRK